MKKVILLFITISSFAQNYLRIENVNENVSSSIEGKYLLLSYKKDNEILHSRVNLDKFILEENIPKPNTGEKIYELAPNKYFKHISNYENQGSYHKFISLDESLNDIISIDFNVSQGNCINNISYCFNEEQDEMIIYIHIGKCNYFGVASISEIKIIKYDFETNTFSSSDIYQPTKYITEILSNEVIDDKVVVRFWDGQNHYFGVCDIETMEVSPLKFSSSISYEKYSAFVINKNVYLVFTYMWLHKVFKINMENYTSEYLTYIINPNTYFSNHLSNYYQPRLNENIILFDENKYLVFTHNSKFVRVILWDNETTFYKEEKPLYNYGTNAYSYPQISIAFDNNLETVSCFFSKNSKVALHNFNLLTKQFTEAQKLKKQPICNGKQFYYSFNYHKRVLIVEKNNKDYMYTIDYDRKAKTLIIAKGFE